ncbi:hypothetical protein E4U14_000766, partial [Claviceps sp. LM454 group G7]
MMQDSDSPQPDSATLKQYYERGYRLWHGLYLAALSSPLDVTALDFQHAFSSHPYFVPELRLDTRCNGTLYATGTSTWKTSTGDCSLPSFEKKYKIPVTAGDSVIDGGHISLLMLAWAYVLSQRWSELIPGAEAIKYTNSSSALSESGERFQRNGWPRRRPRTREGWAARIYHRGKDFRSPWSNTLSPGGHESPPSFSTAVQYIADYAKYHGIEDQSRAAFAAALLIPTRRSISKTFRWPRPAWHNKPPELFAEQCWPPWGEDSDQLDKLMTLSCNVIGMLPLLCSSFVDPDLPCNVSGAWMQGAFAALDEPEAKKPDVLRSMLLQRSPHLGFLWLGAILSDIQGHIMDYARPVVYSIDLHSTAWTATFGMFFQRPRIEARLMFLSQAESHSELPLVPFPPFGTIAVRDCVLEVQLHASCSGSHGLLYAGWAWDCLGNVKVVQDSGSRPMAIRYDKLDQDLDISVLMTTNIFTWLREQDGWPVAERGIRDCLDEHFMSDDDDDVSASPEGDGKSTTYRRHV